MRKLLFILMAIVGLSTSVFLAAPAQAASHSEHLQCSNGAYTASIDVAYNLAYVAQYDVWDVSVRQINISTNPNFKMDRLWLDGESSPGVWSAVAHYGGTIASQNDVSAEFTANYGPYDKLWTIENDSDSPAWRMLAYGVGAGNSTYSCSDYGNVF